MAGRRSRLKMKIIMNKYFLLLFFLMPSLCCAESQVRPVILSDLVTSQLLDKNELSGANVLEKGEESLLARAWLTDHAEHTIDVQYFIWSSDNIGILAAEFLLRAAERGVRVRVIVDDLLIDAPDQSMLALAAHPNIAIKIYNPKHSVGISRAERLYHMLADFRAFNQRMHDKTMIVDSSVAITGGRNMADEYYDYDHQYNFRDRDVLLVGPVVKEMDNNFSTFWQSPLSVSIEDILLNAKDSLGKHQVKEIYSDLHRYAANPENFSLEVRQALTDLPEKFPTLLETMVWDDIVFIHDMPGKNDGQDGLGGGGETTRHLTELIRQAKERVVIQSPYLVMPKGGIDFFAGLVDRGVDVRVITNSLAATDNLEAFSGYSKQREKILKAGIKVFEFKPRPMVRKKLIDRLEALEKSVPIFALHAKTMVVDSKILFVGTFNLDPRSANLNTEVGVVLANRQLAVQVEKAILTDMEPENSWLAGHDDPDSHASFVKRVRIWFLQLFPLEPLL
jgi:cardiolipin synthase C